MRRWCLRILWREEGWVSDVVVSVLVARPAPVGRDGVVQVDAYQRHVG
jgi:hypothetical protein